MIVSAEWYHIHCKSAQCFPAHPYIRLHSYNIYLSIIFVYTVNPPGSDFKLFFYIWHNVDNPYFPILIYLPWVVFSIGCAGLALTNFHFEAIQGSVSLCFRMLEWKQRANFFASLRFNIFSSFSFSSDISASLSLPTENFRLNFFMFFPLCGSSNYGSELEKYNIYRFF
jgi:hypothetical protein